jgi:tetratricopeptide (TPR) repeat protein
VVIEIVSVIGWSTWRSVVREIADDPAAGAIRLASETALRLPPVVRRTRRFPSLDLSRASDDLVMPALRAVSRDQIRWTPADPHGYLNRARALLIEGDIDRAAGVLEAALVRDPTSPSAHTLAALAARSRGMNPQALDHLATAIAVDPSAPQTAVELTADEQEWVRLEGLERRLDYYPRTRSRNVIALARELRERNRSDDGRRLLEAETADPRVILELARWDLLEGMTSEADARLTSLVRRRGMTNAILAEAWSIMAMVRDRRGDLAGAVEAADRALVYDPGSAGPYRVLATMAERRGDTNEALELLRRAWGMNPTDIGLLLAIARTAEKAGRFDDADLALERVVKVQPDDPGLRARQVEFLMRRGDFMEATLALSKALDRFPTDARLLRLAERLRSEISRRG